MTSATIGFKFLKRLMLFSLSATLIFTSCSKNDDPTPTPADKTALQAKITEAQTLYDGSAEGTKPGEYEVGSKATFLVVLNTAKGVNTDANASQTSVTNVLAQLQAAIDAYKAKLIKEIASESLIASWKFSGNANDSSGNGHDGILTAGHPYFGAGMPSLTQDRFGRANMAYHFDNGGNIQVPYSTSLNPQQMSISVWVKKSLGSPVRTLNTATYTILSLNRWNGFKFQLQEANKFFLTVKGVNGTDTAFYDRDDEVAVLDNDIWYHGVVTFKPGEMNFYVNGDLVKSWTNTPNPPITLSEPVDFVIGQDLPTGVYSTDVNDGNHYVNYGGFWTGDLDDILFYNVALDATQVKSIYNNQKDL